MQPDAIFLDLVMPRMDGWEFITAYQNLPICKEEKTKLVMITESVDVDDRHRAEEHPATNHSLNKPITRNMISELIA